MYFKQLVKEDLGCASYIVGCTNAGVCAVIDPRLDMVDDILELTAAKGLKVKAVIETHNPADHISGHGELSRRTGAEIYVHEQADVKYPHKILKDGDELQFGVARLRVIHTPGHRPEHIALTVSDTSRSDDPWLVLTGDSLFIGDMNENLPQRPPNMYNIVERNRDDFAHVEASLYPRPLDALTFQREFEN